MVIIQKSYQGEKPMGILYLVGTPIGNLDDITYRAIKTLNGVDVIAAEDTRHTMKLLNHFEIHKKLISYHEHNKEAIGKEIIKMLIEGKDVAIVSDAGMPAISDPGYDIVLEAVEKEITVIPIPGPNAAITALVASALPTAQFLFVGFLARDKKHLAEDLNKLKYQRETIICYEAPHRIDKTLKAILDVLGNRRIVLVRELTKKHEEFIRGNVSEVIEHLAINKAKGELTLIIDGSSEIETNQEVWWNNLSLIEHVEKYIAQEKTPKEAIQITATDRNISKKIVYKEYHRL